MNSLFKEVFLVIEVDLCVKYEWSQDKVKSKSYRGWCSLIKDIEQWYWTTMKTIFMFALLEMSHPRYLKQLSRFDCWLDKLNQYSGKMCYTEIFVTIGSRGTDFIHQEWFPQWDSLKLKIDVPQTDRSGKSIFHNGISNLLFDTCTYLKGYFMRVKVRGNGRVKWG